MPIVRDVAQASVDPRTSAVVALLSPCDWQDFTAPHVARMVVAALDRHAVRQLLDDLPGVEAGTDWPLRPADPDDPRVKWLLAVLSRRCWRRQTVSRLAADLIASLDTWQTWRDRLAAGLGPFAEG